MADESNQKPDSENGDEQGEVRNDVVVKIGLVGDAQVMWKIDLFWASPYSDKIYRSAFAGWQDNSHG